jgi:hypothetical protein
MKGNGLIINNMEKVLYIIMKKKRMVHLDLEKLLKEIR